MNHNAMKLLVEGVSMAQGVFFDAVYADINIPSYFVGFRIIKSYYICERVMVKIGDIKRVQISIATEYIINFSGFCVFFIEYVKDPTADRPFA